VGELNAPYPVCHSKPFTPRRFNQLDEFALKMEITSATAFVGGRLTARCT
jgi:hypothetical protein